MVALVIGANGDNFGGAIASVLNFEGWEVHVADMKLEDDYDSHMWKIQVSNQVELLKLFRRIGALDLIVYSAGLNIMGDFIDYRITDWMDTMNANLFGVFNTIQSYAKHIRDLEKVQAREMNKKVIVITSNTAFIPRTRSVSYCVSKAGANMLVQQSHRELAPLGFKIIGFAPGVIEDTPMHAKTHEELLELRGWSEEDCYKIRTDLIPMRRFTNRWECADAVSFLASTKGDYFGGEIVRFGGGEK